MRFTVQRYESVPPNETSPDIRSSISSSGYAAGDETRTDETVQAHLLELGQLGEIATRTVDEDPEETVILENGDVHATKSKKEDAEKIAQFGQTYHDRKTGRLVLKDGSCNVTSGNITKRKRKYLVDIFTTLVDMKWRYNVLLFTAAFVISWIGFAIIWFIIAVTHGDNLHAEDHGWESCVANVYDFPTAILFSIETQHTIGYGFRVIEPRCLSAYIVLMIQSCFGVFIQSLMTGLIFAKLSRPKKRSETIMFSRNAVVSKQDGQYCLLFRVGDMRKSHFVGTSIRAILVNDKLTKEGECIPLCQFPLDLQTDTCDGDNFVFLVWPITVVHKITKSSPLWNVSANSLLKEQFEIIVILEGIVESTGMTTQVRTSYLPMEILWGYQLASLMTYQKENGQYKIDYAQFHQVTPLKSMPDCSAKEHCERPLSTDGTRMEGEDEDHAYFTTVVRSNGVRLSMLKRMRNGLRRRKSPRDPPQRPLSAVLPKPEKKPEGEVVDRGSNMSL